MESRDYLELSFRSIQCFANDGKLDLGELESLIEIVLKDGVVDENEKRVLMNIFARLNFDELTDEIQVRIESVRKEYNF